MNLYEVIRYGNDTDDVFTGGPDGPDTCFLVRADNIEQAANLVDAQLALYPSERVTNWCRLIHLLGSDLGRDETARILRGPYLEHAYCHGWRQWSRWEQNAAWVEE